jgi:hypothetical protein
MSTPSKATPPSASTATRPLTTDGPSPLLTVLVAWFVPGAGHAMHRQPRKAAIFGVVILGMFVIGLAASGRLFPFDTSEPLVLLAGVAEWMMGLPRIMAAFGGWGRGIVTNIGFEYGNTFLISAGLLNVLVILDAYDWATGRKKAAR